MPVLQQFAALALPSLLEAAAGVAVQVVLDVLWELAEVVHCTPSLGLEMNGHVHASQEWCTQPVKVVVQSVSLGYPDGVEVNEMKSALAEHLEHLMMAQADLQEMHVWMYDV